MRIPRRLRVAAVGLWTMAGAWSAHDLTDGFIPWYMIEEFGAADEHADALVMTGLWVKVEEGSENSEGTSEAGFQFANWDEYQPTKAEVEERRRKDREKKQRQRRGSDGKFAGESGVPNASPRVSPGDMSGTPQGVTGESAVPVPSRPVPSPSYSSSEFDKSNPDAADMLAYFDSRVEHNGFKRPTRTKKNDDAARLMLTRDGLDGAEIRQVMDWALSDEFWRTNIRSFSKFREKFETLRAQMSRPARSSGMTFDQQRIKANNDLFMQIAEGVAGGDPWTSDSLPQQIEL